MQGLHWHTLTPTHLAGWPRPTNHRPNPPEMYSLLLEAYVKDSSERASLLRAIHTVPVIGRKVTTSAPCTALNSTKRQARQPGKCR